MPIPSYILPSAPAYTEDSVYALIPTPSTPIYTPDAISFTRGSDATRTASNGLIQKSPVNLVQYSEEFTNSYWQKQGVAITSNAATAPNSTLTADLMYATTSATYEGILKTNFPLGSYTLSIYAKASGKNYLFFYVIGASAIQGVWFNIANGTIGTTGSVWTNVTITNVGNGWYRCSASVTLTNTTNYLYYLLSDADNNPNLTINGTDGAYIWGAQLVEGSQPLTYFPTTDRLNVPRIDFSQGSCPALLLEPQRTNSIRNSTMVGASASPSTLPTNWGFVNNGGLTTTVVGVGVENGLNYIDIRFNGTATGTILLATENVGIIAASSNQVWAGSAYVKIVSAPNPPLSYVLGAVYVNSGAYVAQSQVSFVPTSTLARYEVQLTTTPSPITSLYPYLTIGLTTSQSYDFTIRVAAPQMELGSYATTYIPTTNTSVTRLADACFKTGISSLIGQSEGVVYLDTYFTQQTSAGFRAFFSLEGSVANQFSGINPQTTNNGNDISYAGTNYTLTTGRHKIVCTYSQANNQRKLFVDGVLRATSTHTNFLATIDRIGVGCRINPFSGFDGDRPLSTGSGIIALALYNTLLTDSQCVSMTT